jgi:hypothetical protein
MARQFFSVRTKVLLVTLALAHSLDYYCLTPGWVGHETIKASCIHSSAKYRTYLKAGYGPVPLHCPVLILKELRLHSPALLAHLQPWLFSWYTGDCSNTTPEKFQAFLPILACQPICPNPNIEAFSPMLCHAAVREQQGMRLCKDPQLQGQAPLFQHPLLPPPLL